jgi:tetratricopeptide (TPR) repeat protein
MQKQFRQAFAILKDIKEPTEPTEVRSYLLLQSRILVNTGDSMGALKAFQRAIDNQDFPHVIRIWALVLFDFHHAGIYEAAKASVEKLAGDDPWKKSDIQSLEACCPSPEKKWKPDTAAQNVGYYLSILLLVLVLCVILWGLYYLEQWSLDHWKLK